MQLMPQKRLLKKGYCLVHGNGWYGKPIIFQLSISHVWYSKQKLGIHSQQIVNPLHFRRKETASIGSNKILCDAYLNSTLQNWDPVHHQQYSTSTFCARVATYTLYPPSINPISLYVQPFLISFRIVPHIRQLWLPTYILDGLGEQSNARISS